MKNYEILPTEANLIDMLYRNTINRNKDIAYFYEILEAQELASAIAIDGKWGSGKTFFVRQTQMLINALNPFSNMEKKDKVKDSLSRFLPEHNEENCSVAIYYDAWNNDNDTEPILSLIYEITKQLSVEFSLSDKGIVKAAGAIVEAISGHNVNGIRDVLSSDDPFTVFREQKEVEGKIKDFLTDLLAERGNRLVIFIDELDRCKPTFAVHLLEQIKHYIFDDRITYVFSVNLEQLQHTIKHYYGINFDSCRYLDRFFDLTITIPPADMKKFYEHIGLESTYYVDIVTKNVIKMFNFELREITRLYSQVKAAVYEPTHNSQKNNFGFSSEKSKCIILIYIVPLLIGLRMASVSKYYDFIDGRDVEPLIKLFNMDEEMPVLDNMLSPDESYIKQNGKRKVTRDEIINRFYSAIFVNQYNGRQYTAILGDYEFSKGAKEYALRASNMMMDYTGLSRY